MVFNIIELFVLVCSLITAIKAIRTNRKIARTKATLDIIIADSKDDLYTLAWTDTFKLVHQKVDFYSIMFTESLTYKKEKLDLIPCPRS